MDTAVGPDSDHGDRCGHRTDPTHHSAAGNLTDLLLQREGVP
ncbi:hypothetical protein O982_24000 [Mycobacterium avium 10-5581]|nr:hypothetical protein O982_24000 [Mycobacterium avium 10-5581]